MSCSACRVCARESSSCRSAADLDGIQRFNSLKVEWRATSYKCESSKSFKYNVDPELPLLSFFFFFL